MSKQMQAVIMAGGEGSRLRPLTSNMPKPMLPVANKPLMEHIIELLRGHGFTDVVATVQFLSSVIRNYFRDGSDLGVSLAYATEEVPLGTAGSVLGARDLLSGSVLVISGDALTDLDLTEVVDFHKARGAAATLVLKRMQDPLEFGIVMTAEDGQIQRFLEKPTWGQVFSDTINTGIYVLEPEVLDLIPPDQPHDFSSELFPTMLDKGLPIFGFVTDSYWTDVGNTEAYLQANRDALAGSVRVEHQGFELRPDVWVGEDVDMDTTARLEGPALIGDNAQIGPGATVGPFAVIGANGIVGDDATVAGGVVMDRAYIGNYARVRGGVVGRGASLGAGGTLEEGAVLGDEAVVGDGALVKPRVRVYPSRTVEAGAIVTQSVVREHRASRSLFGGTGVSGRVNLTVTPVVAVRLGMAFGTVLKRRSVVVTGRDASRAARTIKRALIAGLNSTGITCHDLELASMPLTRFIVRSEQASAGISVRTSPLDPENVEIRLFDSDGRDIAESDQRKIERIFYREDYRRASAAKLGELEFPPHAPEQYVSGLLRAIDLDTIRAKASGLKAVVDYAYGPVSLIGPSIMGRLGIDVLGVHAYTDENRPLLAREDIQKMADNLRDHVRKSGSDIGVLIEPGGEIAHLVDDRGRGISHERALLAFLRHESKRGIEAAAVPVSTTSAAEAMVEGTGAKLQRTPVGLASMMAHVARRGAGFAGNAQGALIFPSFMPASDALMTFCKAVEVVAAAGRSFSEIVDELPDVHVARRDVEAPWNVKGTVMRQLAAGAQGRLVLVDGVKVVQDDRWALVIPYPDAPLCGIWAEAPTAQEAEELADEYATLVEKVVASGREETY